MIIIMTIGFVIVASLAMIAPLFLRLQSVVAYFQWVLGIAIVGSLFLALFKWLFWPAITSSVGG